MYMVLLQNNNLLLGGVPETIGLLIFGVGLISLTMLLRWFFKLSEKDDVIEESMETIPGKINQ